MRWNYFSIPNFNGPTVAVWEWINNFNPHCMNECNYSFMLRLRLIHWRMHCENSNDINLVPQENFDTKWVDVDITKVNVKIKEICQLNKCIFIRIVYFKPHSITQSLFNRAFLCYISTSKITLGHIPLPRSCTRYNACRDITIIKRMGKRSKGGHYL